MKEHDISLIIGVGWSGAMALSSLSSALNGPKFSFVSLGLIYCSKHCPLLSFSTIFVKLKICDLPEIDQTDDS